MGDVRIEISMSLDGYVAGPEPSQDDPLGVGGEALHEWAFKQAAFGEMHGRGPDGETGPDNDILAESGEGYGAVIMGKRMFCGEDGPWGEEPPTGWWGDDPPFRSPVFVLTHHEREPLELSDTRFTFVTDGFESALGQAQDAAGDLDVQIAGGASAAQQGLAAGAVDEIQVHIAPVLLGGGTRLFEADGTGLRRLRPTRIVAETPDVTHLRYAIER
jgi:dihydrofolate reductase